MVALSGLTPLATRVLDCFPSGQYALLGLLQVLDVSADDGIPTAAVECRVRPRLLLNPSFVAVRASTPETLFMLVMHELHHVLLGHTRLFPRVTAVDNLVFDAVINALLCRMFPDPAYTCFFTDLYDAGAFPECLLRPADGWRPDAPAPTPPALADPALAAVAELHRALYAPVGVGYQELYDVLRAQVSESAAATVPLVGSHRAGGSADGDLETRSPILYDLVRGVVERWPQPPDPIAGRSFSDLLRDTTVAPRRPSERQSLRQLLRRIGGDVARSRAPRARAPVPVTIQTPVPSRDRRAIVQRALGARPLLYREGLALPGRCPIGDRVHVYLDVSGSVSVHLDALYGAVVDCRAFVYPTVHLFSTVVADVTLAELRRGTRRTTDGTDITCVARHLAEHRIRRAVLITDGYVGPPRGSDRETLLAVRLGVALTSHGATRNDLDGVVDHWTVLRETA